MRSGCAPSVCNSADGPLRSWIALSIGLAALGHFFWEAAQLPLYTLWRTGTPHEIVFALIRCTGRRCSDHDSDTGGSGCARAALSLASFRLAMVFTAIVLGAGYTIFSEWLNVEIRRSWSYTAAMPVVPFLGTGLTPLLQWLIVPGLALAMIGYRYRRAPRPVPLRGPASPRNRSFPRRGGSETSLS
jgi:hypothetical protein